MEEELFSRKSSLKFPAAELKGSFDRKFEKSLPKVWEILFYFLNSFFSLITFFYLWFNWSHKLSLEKLLWTRKRNVDKTAKKKC